MSLWPRVLRRRAQQQRGCNGKRAEAYNPFSERGLDKFSQLYEELNAKRKIIAAQTGTEVSLVRFRTESRTGEWVPVLPRPSDASASSVDMFQYPDNSGNIASDAGEHVSGVDMAASKKVVVKTGWAAASKAHLVCFIRNKSWKQISKASVGLTITVAFFCFAKLPVIGTIAVIAFCAWAFWRVRRMLRLLTDQLQTMEARIFINERQDHQESVLPSVDAPEHIRLSSIRVSDFQAGSSLIKTQSAPASPKINFSDASTSRSKALRHSGRVEFVRKKSNSCDLASTNLGRKSKTQEMSSSRSKSKREEEMLNPSKAKHTTSKMSDKKNKKLRSQHKGMNHVDAKDEKSSTAMAVTSLLVVLSSTLLGRTQAIIITAFFFLLLQMLTSRSRQRQLAFLKGASKSNPIGGKVIFNKRSDTSTSHLDITSSEYRKKVIIEGLLERPNRW